MVFASTVPETPKQDSTPRRRSTYACSHLRMNNEPVVVNDGETYQLARAIVGNTNPRSTVFATFGCKQRGTHDMEKTYVRDLCLTSWGRSCPFAVDP